MADYRLRDRLLHIVDAIDSIDGFLTGKNFDDYVSDRMLRDAVERNLERLSEASRYIPDDLKAKYRKVSWQQVAGIGNILRHGYEGVIDRLIFDTARNDLVPLRDAVEAMIREVEGGAAD